MVNGKIEVDNNKLGKRDAIGIWELENVDIVAKEDSEIIIIEVPMN